MPDFEAPIGNQTVALGRDAQLSCKIARLGNFRTAWLRVKDKGILTIHTNVITRNYRFGLVVDSADTEASANFVLTIHNVQPSDRGEYMCQINSVPMKSAVGYLDVLTPPVFEDNSAAATDDSMSSPPAPANQDELNDSAAASTNSTQVTVRENSSVTLSCQARGHPSPTITWRREDGKRILLDGRQATDDEDNSTAPLEVRNSTALTFTSTHRSNSGAYLCIASNGVQPSASKRQLLDVQFSPVLKLPAAEVAGYVGQREARLECVVDLNPVGSYHWIKLTTTTTNTDRRPVVTNQEDDLWLVEHDELMQSDKYDIVMKQISSERVHMSLTLRHIQRQDFSWFKCIAKNALGLQSNFIRFYETPAPPPTPPPSPGFSFNSIFRSAGSSTTNAQQAAAPPKQQGNEPTPPSEQPDESMSRSGGQPRAHTRSSWIQRSTQGNSASSRSSLASSSSSSSSSSAASSSLAVPSSMTSALFFLLLLLFTTANSSLLNCCRQLKAKLVPYVSTTGPAQPKVAPFPATT